MIKDWILVLNFFIAILTHYRYHCSASNTRRICDVRTSSLYYAKQNFQRALQTSECREIESERRFVIHIRATRLIIMSSNKRKFCMITFLIPIAVFFIFTWIATRAGSSFLCCFQRPLFLRNHCIRKRFIPNQNHFVRKDTTFYCNSILV